MLLHNILIHVFSLSLSCLLHLHLNVFQVIWNTSVTVLVDIWTPESVCNKCESSARVHRVCWSHYVRHLQRHLIGGSPQHAHRYDEQLLPAHRSESWPQEFKKPEIYCIFTDFINFACTHCKQVPIVQTFRRKYSTSWWIEILDLFTFKDLFLIKEKFEVGKTFNVYKSHGDQGVIYLIKNTIKRVILGNTTTI